VNEFLYCNGEVVKLWHYPRGPDSGFRVYPGVGNRQTWFDTSPLSHAMGEPCCIVEPWPAGTQPLPNGNSPFTGSISKTTTMPHAALARTQSSPSPLLPNGKYRRADSRCPGPRRREIHLRTGDPATGCGFHRGDRRQERQGISGQRQGTYLPGHPRGRLQQHDRTKHRRIFLQAFQPGFPQTIEAGQERALVALNAAADAPAVTEEMARKIRVVAKAKIGDRVVEKSLGDLGKLTLGASPKVIAQLLPGSSADAGSVILSIRPGETITARVSVQRNGFTGQVDFGKDDSGRNLPHGVYVDNIGLNGLMIPEGLVEQRFAITGPNGSSRRSVGSIFIPLRTAARPPSRSRSGWWSRGRRSLSAGISFALVLEIARAEELRLGVELVP